MTRPLHDWDAIYQASYPPPWDIGRPQPPFVHLADAGLLSGRLLDAGCGTGEHTLLAAAHGADAVGIDVALPAIEQARRKATERAVAARFEVADALALDRLGLTFDTIIDSGVFHVFDDNDRPKYVTSLGSVLQPGGTCYLMCFSDRQPGEIGPRRVRQDEITASFSDGWDVADISAAQFELNRDFGSTTAEAWLATIHRSAEQGS
jgi:cyclopropane fatty-acyl-phospholipid synthase-like methyltransferase